MKTKSRIEDLFDEGVRLSIDAHAALEKQKVGLLRAGNTGIAALNAKGDMEVAGKCHRQTMLRLLGIAAEDADYSKELMFDSGRGNEDLWYSVLSKSYKDGVILREEEVPIQWTTSNGTPVSGRPDLVLCTTDKKPVLGLELKLICSFWTARSVLLGEPKTMHLMQAAHYSWQLGVPFELWYTSRVDWPVMGWAGKHLPKPGEPGSEHIELDDKGEPRKVVPFKLGFVLTTDEEGFIHYSVVGREEQPIKSIVSVQRIKDYYEFVSRMVQDKTLGPRPQNLTAQGDKASWSFCSYCPLKSTCDAHESDFDTWLQAAKGVVPKAE